MKQAGNSKLKSFFHSLTFELLALYFCISIIIMALGSYFVYNFAINTFQKRTQEYIYEQFQQSEYNIEKLQSEVQRLYNLFIVNDTMQEFIKTKNIDYTFESIDMQQNVFDRISDVTDKINNSLINSIYLFSNNKMIGKSRSRTVVIPEGTNHRFYTSGMYEKAWNSYPKPVWYAGVTDVWFYNLPGNQNANYVISMALGFKPLLEANLTGVTVFNIDEKEFCSTYSKFITSPEDLTYIIDSNGTIISGICKADIGKKGIFTPEPGVSFKSFNFTEGKANKMIVYYKLNETGWYIVREIPMEVLQSDAVILQRVAVFIFVISLVLIVCVSFFTMKRITKPLSSLAAKMKDMGKGNLGVTLQRIPRNELGLVIRRFNEMSLNIRELVTKNTEVEREKKELEIEALQYQINPHFLYNTLNMIKWMAAVIKADNILDSVVALGNILRLLFSSNEPLCSVNEEMSYLENYIKIMNWRFNNKIQFTFDIPGQLMNYKIIKFVLQPVIENSVVHGTGKQGSLIDIAIHIEETGDNLIVVISDNGTGISPETLENIKNNLNIPFAQNEKIESIGLRNVNRRIKLNFGEMYGISIDSREGEGTRVSIRLPKIAESKSEIV